MDLTNVDLAATVEIGYGFVEVYPDEGIKPKRGEKLNVECRIVLYDLKQTIFDMQDNPI